jgi:hypothetical protein
MEVTVVLLMEALVVLMAMVWYGIALNGGIANGASGNNAGKGGIAIGPGSVADGTSGTGNGKGNSRSVALDGGHTHQGCTDAIGKMSVNPP